MKNYIKARYSNQITQREIRHNQISYQAAVEGIVLMENDGSLPIKAGGKIALFGSGGRRTLKGGTGSGEVFSRHFCTLEEGLENAGFKITTKKWLDDYDQYCLLAEEEKKKILKRSLLKFNLLQIINASLGLNILPNESEITEEDVHASDTDTCIYVIARQSGEGTDRNFDNQDNNLTAVEYRNIQICAAHYPKTIVVFNGGCSFNLSFLDEIQGINAFVNLGQLGSEAGNAFADVITGKATPSGHLTTTWETRYEDLPFAKEFGYLKGSSTDENYKEGIYVGYRYFDSFDIAPKYPFGYGLSYTTFDIQLIEAVMKKTGFKAKVKVVNKGGYSGKAVVQVYVSSPAGNTYKEYQKLAAFGKTRDLAPEQEETLTLSFDLASVAYFSEEKRAFVLDKGSYLIRIGEHSRATTVAALIELDDSVIVSKHQSLPKPKVAFEELSGPVYAHQDNLSQAVKLQAKAADLATITYEYHKPAMVADPQVDKIMQQLSIREMVDIVVGDGMFGNDPVVNVPGCAGNTTSRYLQKGLINVAMCDGPAGLRLPQRSAIYKDGKTKAVDPPIEAMKYLPDFLKRRLFADPQEDTLIYQYATAWPTARACAQSWNLELIEEIGKAIGIEMEEYGVTYWLGPAMNIIRNPLCGRNYEYYSEDPYLTGKMAAAVTRGVQSVEGCYATLKHFFANNLETNRQYSCSNLHERTMREIYLRGYEIAVKESKPKSVMSSYNLVNGIYSANLYETLIGVLRNEWGFQGVVMSDWFATRKGTAKNGRALASGNDLIMPGTKANKKRILQELEAGQISEEDIRWCCANVIQSIVHSRIAREVDPADYL